MRRRIERVLDRATREAWRDGLAWYLVAHDTARELFPNEPDRGAALLALFSPQVSWLRCVDLARRAVGRGRAAGHYGFIVERANRLLAGEPARLLLRGPKVVSFYECIADPAHLSAVVIDRHSAKVAGLNPKRLTSRRYRLAAKGYRRVAAERGLLPLQVQAVTWCQWRAERGLAPSLVL